MPGDRVQSLVQEVGSHMPFWHGQKIFKKIKAKLSAFFWWNAIFLRASLIAQLVKNLPAMQATPGHFLIRTTDYSSLTYIHILHFLKNGSSKPIIKKKNVCCLVFKLCLTLVIPWPVTRLAPVSMGFSRQEYWSGLPVPLPRDLPDPGIKPTSLTLAGRFFTTEPPGSPQEKVDSICY